jgi:hypothetical protein
MRIIADTRLEETIISISVIQSMHENEMPSVEGRNDEFIDILILLFFQFL